MRVVMIRGSGEAGVDGAPWWVASDVCRALGVYLRADGGVNTTAALTKLGSDERMNLPYVEAKRIGLQAAASRVWGVSLISESGLHKLIMRSDKPEAWAFQGWVSSNVSHVLGIVQHGRAFDFLAEDEKQVIRKCGQTSLKGHGSYGLGWRTRR